MDLVEAFFEFGRPSSSEDSRAAHREQAGRVLLAELGMLARRLDATEDMKEEAVQETLVKLARGGFRLVEDPGVTEKRVRGYLTKALRNNLISRIRKTRRETTSGEKPEIEPPGIKGSVGPALGPKDLAGAAARVRDELIPGLGIRRRAGVTEAMKEAWSEMWRLATGEITLERLIAERVGPEAGQEEFVRERNALYQRHSRTRRRVLWWVERLRQRGRIADDDAADIEALVDLLRRRS